MIRRSGRIEQEDADYAKDPDKDMSIIGYMFMVHGYVVSWKTTLQHVVALFTIETEYMALTKVVKKRIWLKGLLIELRINLRISGILERLKRKDGQQKDKLQLTSFTQGGSGPKSNIAWIYLRRG
ncbi:hypothetical protein Tco_0572945 [Tanacetum coccineum]